MMSGVSLTNGGGVAVLELSGVAVRRAGREILGGIDWTVEAGERWAIIGPNGSGKSTLLSIASTYLWPSRGSVSVLGERMGRVDARELRRRIGYVSASLAAALGDDVTAHDAVLSARHAALATWWHDFSDEDRARASELLERMGCAALAEQRLGTLSSGERQRIQIARTLMTEPELILLDEPSAGLDVGARERLALRLAELVKDPAIAALILVTHHVEEIPAGTTHALVLKAGRIVSAGPIEQVLGGPALSEAFDLPLVVERAGGRYWARAAGSPAE